MVPHARLFIGAALFYLPAAAVVGILMIYFPPHAGVYLRVHAHLMLLGWVSMLLFGLVYQFLPHWTGNVEVNARLARLQFILLNVGVIGLAVFWSFGGHRLRKGLAYKPFDHAAGIFAIILLISFILFILVAGKALGRSRADSGG